ncbi:MAG: ABC transporter permease [Deinococcales bacterium]
MSRYILKRLLFLTFTLALVSVLIFSIMEFLPGDAATVILGQMATPEDLAILRAKLGLDRPAPERYLHWVAGILRGDWGESLRLKTEVGGILLERLRNSSALALFTFILAVPSGILLGTLAGLWRDRLPDRLISMGTLLAVSLPEFVTGTFLIIIFASWLQILPPSSLIDPDANLSASIQFLILPAITMLFVMWAHITRMTRSSMIEVMGSNYIRTAVLKGLPRNKVVFSHALRNALLPTISVIAMNIGWLFGGLIVVESVFAYPGLGQLLLFAIRNQDVPLLQAVTLLIAAIYMLSNLAADLLYRLFNPRIRLQ